MEGGGGSGNKTTGGLAGFFGAGGAGYSHADLAGVPLTGMNPLSPYLNVDPRYLVQDTDEFILPTGANKTRGRFELAFFTIGGCCMTGAAFGAMNGLRLGLKETQNMAWSKPRNVQILNMVTRQGALWANTLGSLALLYSAFGVIIEKTRGAEDDLNTVAAGTMTGMLYKCTETEFHHGAQASLKLLSSSDPPRLGLPSIGIRGGLRGIARGGLTGLTLTSLYALYNNWEHMKGSLLQQSL
ncbi:mitochondrial import inner membrane translocase subunit Tim23 isoform X1 [Macaca mulatta]